MNRPKRAPNTLLFVFCCPLCKEKFKFIDFDSPIDGVKLSFCMLCKAPFVFHTFIPHQINKDTGKKAVDEINRINEKPWSAKLITFADKQLSEVEPDILFLPAPAVQPAGVILKEDQLLPEFEKELRLRWWDKLERDILDYESSLPPLRSRILGKCNQWLSDVKQFFSGGKDFPPVQTDTKKIDLSKLKACYQHWLSSENTPAELKKYEAQLLTQAGRLLDMWQEAQKNVVPATEELQSLQLAIIKLYQEMSFLRKFDKEYKPMNIFSSELVNLANHFFGYEWSLKSYPSAKLGIQEIREQYELNLKRLFLLNVEGFAKVELYHRLGLFKEATELLENNNFIHDFRDPEIAIQCCNQLRKRIRQQNKRPFKFVFNALVPLREF